MWAPKGNQAATSPKGGLLRQKHTHGQVQLYPILRERDCWTSAGCQALHTEPGHGHHTFGAESTHQPRQGLLSRDGSSVRRKATRVSYGSGFLTDGAWDLLKTGWSYAQQACTQQASRTRNREVAAHLVLVAVD